MAWHDHQDDEGPSEADIHRFGDAGSGADGLDENLVDCPRCRASVWWDSEQCPKCGAWLSEADRGGQSSWPMWLIAGVVALLVAALAMLSIA